MGRVWAVCPGVGRRERGSAVDLVADQWKNESEGPAAAADSRTNVFFG